MPNLRKAGSLGSGSMPAVGTRKSTKVFVPKAAAVAAETEDEPVAVVLRSGKRLHLSRPPGSKVDGGGFRDEWVTLLDDAAAEEARWCGRGLDDVRGGEEVVVPSETGVGAPGVQGNGEGMELLISRFGRWYSRKRKRSPQPQDHVCTSPSNVEDKDGTGGLPVEEGVLLECEEVVDRRFKTSEPARTFAQRFGIRWTGGWSRETALVVLVDPSVTDSVSQFSRFFVSISEGLRRNRVVKLVHFACFLLSEPIGGVFSQHGIHFLLVRIDYHDCFTNTQVHAGMCRISSLLIPDPLIFVNFLVLPSYFKSLHETMFLRSRFMPVPVPLKHLQKTCQGNLENVVDNNIVASMTADMAENVELPSMNKFLAPPVQSASVDIADSSKEGVIFHSPVVVEMELNINGLKQSGKKAVNGDIHRVKNLKSPPQSTATHRSMITRSQKRRTSLRSVRRRPTPQNINRTFPVIPLRPKSKPGTRVNLAKQKIVNIDDSTESEYYAVPLVSSNGTVKKPSQRSNDDRMKELKSIVTGIKLKIESISCKACILVIEQDRCWREEGAEVMMGSSDSGEWYLAVKVNGLLRYKHKPQEVRSSVPNRYTHSMIWTGEGSWKLEFIDRMDWIIFKQLHGECLERNCPDGTAISIPVPEVILVPDYESRSQGTFLRPDSYIKTKYTEIERVLSGQVPYYDLDYADEEWIKQFNSSASQESRCVSQLSEDNFEKMIFSFEKAAYNNPDAGINQDGAIGLCSGLTDKETVAAVFGYWLKKKKQKRPPLIRFFQAYPLQKMHIIQGSFLRKKRSLKRQGSSMGRGKPAFYVQAGAMQEEMRRVREAETAASKAEEVATKLRSKAQTLMSNADLLTYKSVMALRLAEALKNLGSADFL